MDRERLDSEQIQFLPVEAALPVEHPVGQLRGTALADIVPDPAKEFRQ